MLAKEEDAMKKLVQAAAASESQKLQSELQALEDSGSGGGGMGGRLGAGAGTKRKLTQQSGALSSLWANEVSSVCSRCLGEGG